MQRWKRAEVHWRGPVASASPAGEDADDAGVPGGFYTPCRLHRPHQHGLLEQENAGYARELVEVPTGQLLGERVESQGIT